MGAEEPPKGQGRKVGVRFPASPSSPGPPHPAPPLLRGGHSFTRERETAARAEFLQGSTERCCKSGRRVWQARGTRSRRGGGSGSGSLVSKVSCPREAKDCGGGSGGGGGGGGSRQRACVSSRPCSLLSARSPPPPPALSSSFPRAASPAPSPPPPRAAGPFSLNAGRGGAGRGGRGWTPAQGSLSFKCRTSLWGSFCPLEGFTEAEVLGDLRRQWRANRWDVKYSEITGR